MFEVENHDIDDYLVIDEDESYDSDKIDSDIEAELYSTIHHEVPSSESQNSSAQQNKNSIKIISEEQGNVRVEDPFVCDINSNNLCTSFESPLKSAHWEARQVQSSNRPLKRKLEMISDILGTIQMPTDLPNKKKRARNSHRKKSQVTAPPNRTVDDSDSDDSVILIDSDELGKIQTNVEEVFNVVSSDSDSSSSMDGRVHFRRSLIEDSLFNTNSTTASQGDPWYVNSTDLYRRKQASNRYHETAVLKCNYCTKKGHASKSCPERRIVKCYICGGKHTIIECPNKICSRCLQIGHDKWRCFRRVESCCYICNMQGHGMKDCPDNWRRYHLTTAGKKIIQGKVEYRNTPIYCFNCGSQGHYGYHCKRPRNSNIPATCTAIISYRDVNFQVGNVKPNAPQPLPVREEVQRFPAHKVSPKKQKN